MDDLESGYLMAVAGALVWTPRLLRSWLDACGSPRALLDAAFGDAADRPPALEPFGSQALERLRAVDDDRARTALSDLEASGCRLVVDTDREYPPGLSDLIDRPPLLYVKGAVEAIGARPIAIVGSRAATAYGRNVAAELATDFGAMGASIVSGLARGIDVAAHAAALAAGTPTIAVLGSGLGALYPAYHSLLADDIVAAGGALVSEFPPPMAARAHHFPMRNRIVAALGVATVVVEASERSGALITARLADELGRRVFAVPGDIGRPTSVGTNGLIKDGVTLITGAADAAELLGWGAPAGRSDGADAHDDPILAQLSRAGTHIDHLAAQTGIDAGALLARLTLLELRGAVRRLPGGHFAAVNAR